jgi:hypothetical protein
VFTNPSGGPETVRITNIFNGHWNMSMNYLGLQSLRNRESRHLLWSYSMSHDRVPDVIILNSGLHDGNYWTSVFSFAQAAELLQGSGLESWLRRRLVVTPCRGCSIGLQWRLGATLGI